MFHTCVIHVHTVLLHVPYLVPTCFHCFLCVSYFLPYPVSTFSLLCFLYLFVYGPICGFSDFLKFPWTFSDFLKLSLKHVNKHTKTSKHFQNNKKIQKQQKYVVSDQLAKKPYPTLFILFPSFSYFPLPSPTFPTFPLPSPTFFDLLRPSSTFFNLELSQTFWEQTPGDPGTPGGPPSKHSKTIKNIQKYLKTSNWPLYMFVPYVPYRSLPPLPFPTSSTFSYLLYLLYLFLPPLAFPTSSAFSTFSASSSCSYLLYLLYLHKVFKIIQKYSADLSIKSTKATIIIVAHTFFNFL